METTAVGSQRVDLLGGASGGAECGTRCFSLGWEYVRYPSPLSKMLEREPTHARRDRGGKE